LRLKTTVSDSSLSSAVREFHTDGQMKTTVIFRKNDAKGGQTRILQCNNYVINYNFCHYHYSCLVSTTRTEMATGIMSIVGRDTTLHRSLKIRLITLLVWTLTPHDCESWTLKKVDQKRFLQ